MNDPLAFFLTWNTYGTWLPGDERGWVEYMRRWQLPNPIRELEASARMAENSCRLTIEQRVAVQLQIAETTRIRGWVLHAVNCRSNHVHVVVSALQTKPKKVRVDLKAWATRCLKERFDSERQNWWAERGSIRHLHREDEVLAAASYVRDAQDRMQAPAPAIRMFP